MAVGDIKGDEAVIEILTAGVAVTKGDVVHFETADNKYDPVVDNDTGPYAVAIEAASGDTVTFRAVTWGRVEVALSGTGDVAVGTPVSPATTGGVKLATNPSGLVCGMAAEAATTSGDLITLWVNRGGQ